MGWYSVKTWATLMLKSISVPVFWLKQPISYAALPLVDQMPQRNAHSKWAAPIVVAKKANGSIQLDADFSIRFNTAFKDHDYLLSIPEDLFTLLDVTSSFEKIDLVKVYLQVKVTKISKKLLMINTHYRLFPYTKLSFGIKSVPSTGCIG